MLGSLITKQMEFYVFKKLYSCSYALINHTLKCCSSTYIKKKRVSNTSYRDVMSPTKKYNLFYGAEHVLMNLSDEDKRRMDDIRIELAAYNQKSFLPLDLTPEDWIFLLLSDNQRQRKAYFLYRSKTLMSKIKEKNIARESGVKPAIQEEQEQEHSDAIVNLKFLPKIKPSALRNKLNSVLLNSSELSQPLVFDMSFENFMRPQDVNNLASQLTMMYALMKSNYTTDPFNIYMTNFDPTSFTYWCCRRHMIKGGKIEDRNFNETAITATEKSFIDLFPRERLVYLTPTSRDVFHAGEWNHDDVYIIGGFVDKVDKRPHTYTKAKKLGIRTKSLPFERYIKWECGNKSLSLDVIFKMLITARDTNGNWQKAIIDHVPKRKIIPSETRDVKRFQRLLNKI